MHGLNEKYSRTAKYGGFSPLPVMFISIIAGGVVIFGISSASAMPLKNLHATQIIKSTQNQNNVINVNVSRETTTKQVNNLPSSAEDMCLSLLNMRQYLPSESFADRYRRAAGLAVSGVPSDKASDKREILLTKKNNQLIIVESKGKAGLFSECRKAQNNLLKGSIAG